MAGPQKKKKSSKKKSATMRQRANAYYRKHASRKKKMMAQTAPKSRGCAKKLLKHGGKHYKGRYSQSKRKPRAYVKALGRTECKGPRLQQLLKRLSTLKKQISKKKSAQKAKPKRQAAAKPKRQSKGKRLSRPKDLNQLARLLAHHRHYKTASKQQFIEMIEKEMSKYRSNVTAAERRELVAGAVDNMMRVQTYPKMMYFLKRLFWEAHEMADQHFDKHTATARKWAARSSDL